MGIQPHARQREVSRWLIVSIIINYFYRAAGCVRFSVVTETAECVRSVCLAYFVLRRLSSQPWFVLCLPVEIHDSAMHVTRLFQLHSIPAASLAMYRDPPPLCLPFSRLSLLWCRAVKVVYGARGFIVVGVLLISQLGDLGQRDEALRNQTMNTTADCRAVGDPFVQYVDRYV